MAKETTSDLQTQEKQALEREGMRPGLVFRPDVDIVERPDDFLVTADVPGVDEQNIDVRLEEGVLSIDATQATEVDSTWTPIHAEYRQKGGAPGVDGERFADIEGYGVERWLGELTEELREKT